MDNEVTVDALEQITEAFELPSFGVEEGIIRSWSSPIAALLDRSEDQAVGQPCRVLGCTLEGACPLKRNRWSSQIMPLRGGQGHSWIRQIVIPTGNGGGLEIWLPTGPPPEDPVVELGGVTSSAASMVPVLERLKQLSSAGLPLHLEGARGTGHRHLALALHAHVDLGAPLELLHGSELDPEQIRRLRTLRGTHLYIADVDDVPWDLQHWLGDVLDNADTQQLLVITSARLSLKQLVRSKRLQESLACALRVGQVVLPELQERLADLPALIWAELDRCNERHGRKVLAVDPDAFELLEVYTWPGNITELQQVIRSAYAVGGGRRLQRAHLPVHLLDGEASTGGTAPDGRAQRMREALRLANGNSTKAAEDLGVSRSTLWRWRQRYGI